MKNRKNKLINLLKLGILFFGTSLFLSSCENDEIIPQQIQSNHQKFELQKFQKKDNQDFLIKEFENLGISKKQIKSEKIIQSKNYNFSVFTEDVMVNETNNSKTYTFQVQSFQENYLKNLVVNLNTVTNEVSKFLVTYYKNGDDYDFTKTNVLKLSDRHSKTFQKTSDPDCYETSVWEEVTVDYACGSGDHIGSSDYDDCNLDGFDKPFSITNGYWVSVDLCYIEDVSCRGCPDGTSNTSSGSTGSSSGVNTAPLDSLSYALFQFFKDLNQQQRDFFDDNPNLKTKIQNFLEKNDSVEALNFAQMSTDRLISDPNLSFEALLIEEQIKDDNLDPCSKGILTQLKNLQSNDIAKIIQRFRSPDSTYDWEIKVGIPTNPNNSAETNWAVDGNNNSIDNSYLTIIKSSYINQATNLAIARTILHESIHAYIISYFDELISNPSILNSFQDNFPFLWNFLVAKTNGVEIGNIEDAHHQEMAEKFVFIIGDALAEYDNNQQDDTYYEYLAWGALMNTDAFDGAIAPGGYMTQSEQEAILIANNQEDTNGPLAKGTPCN